ncbi:DUF5131 family protein [Paenibacillus koleovorans]|uniref:DUF5131 family protein n=1 Tax=Paenibacillus koleovorans TaxID=121608 RepID=UPI000FD7E8A3|nr:phage Gp37/Gp68 family protein [Paenibacillus koleovorans]
MSDKSKIEWTDATWNPVTGCTKVSEGCRNCYAMTLAERFRGTTGHYYEHGFDITLRPEKLDQPLRWKRPRKIFVNSMSDMFHPDVPFEYIRAVWARMALCPQHTFQVLTKRPERALAYFAWMRKQEFKVEEALPNVWLGVSVENQKAADERIPLLLQTPAVVRFLSCEPLLEEVNIWRWIDPIRTGWPTPQEIHQVIAGGESGHKARPMHPEWARSLRDQCLDADVPFFFKQWGEWIGFHEAAHSQCLSPAVEKRAKWFTFSEGGSVLRVGKQNAGRELDGREWNEFPEVVHS